MYRRRIVERSYLDYSSVPILTNFTSNEKAIFFAAREDFDADSAEEYAMEKELSRFLNSAAGREDFDTGSAEESDTEKGPSDFLNPLEMEKNVTMQLEFCEFYFKVIGRLMARGEHRNNVKNVRRFFYHLRSVMDSWCQLRDSYEPEDNELKDTLYYRIAYVYRNSMCISGAVAYHFESFLSQNSKVLGKLLEKREIRICSVGGGSPSDVVALIKVIESHADDGEDLDIRVSVIDEDEKWRGACMTALRCLERFRNAAWKIDFVRADIFQAFSAEVSNAIESADIVSMVKFFSELEKFRNSTELKTEIIRRVDELVRPGSLVFLLDVPQPSIIDASGGHSGKLPGQCLLYEAAYDLYTMEDAVIERHFQLYNEEFRGNLGNTVMVVFCRIWLKMYTEPAWETRMSDKAVRARHHVAELRDFREKLIEDCELFRQLETESFKEWKACVSKKLSKTGCKKREIREIIAPVKSSLNGILKVKKALTVSAQKEISKQLQKAKQDLFDSKTAVYGDKRELAEAKRNIYQLSVKDLLEHLKLKYPAPTKSSDKRIDSREPWHGIVSSSQCER